MSVLNFKSKQIECSAKGEVPLFRDEICSLMVKESIPKTISFTGLRQGEVKVSEFRLEQYLNAHSPTCHG